MVKLKVLLATILLAGCVTIKNPTSEHLSGEWEHIGLVYSRLILDSQSSGYLVVLGVDGNSGFLKVSDFVSGENGFTIKLTDESDAEGEATLFYGVLYEFQTLCFSEIDEDETSMDEYCFKRLSDIEKLRDEATEIIESLNNKKPNGAMRLGPREGARPVG